MIVVCNKCDTKYELSKAQIDLDGSEVRCTKCGYVWFEKVHNARGNMSFLADSFIGSLSKNNKKRSWRVYIEPFILFIILASLTVYAFYDKIFF